MNGRIIKILLSVSVLSLVFTSLIPLLSQSLNQFSINKSYVFFFCNGLMIFIAKNSSLPSDHSSSAIDLDGVASSQHVVHPQEHDHMVAVESSDQQQHREEEEEEEEKRVVMADSQEEVDETEEEEAEEKRMIWAESQEEDEVISETEEEEETEGNNKGVWMAEEEEEEKVEELNKKCEDFIRKMKRAFCSEPSLYCDYSDFDHHHAHMATVR